MRRLQQSLNTISISALLCALVLAHPAFAQNDPVPQAVAGSVLLRGGNPNGETCTIPAASDGAWVYSPSCDNERSVLLVKSLPSTSTVTLSDKDCSESTSKQDWWVKLQATARETSTEAIGVSNIVDQAVEWKTNPDKAYVAPNLRIVGADIKKSTHTSRCTSLQLPTTATVAPTLLKFQLQAAQEMVSDGSYTKANCQDGPMVNMYSINRDKFSFQCAKVTDAQGNLYRPDFAGELVVKINEGIRECGAEAVVTGVWRFNDTTQRIVCSRLVNVKNAQVLRGSDPTTQREVGYNDHFVMCERPGSNAPAVLVSRENYVFTGYGFGGQVRRAQCSKLAKPSS